MFSSFWNRKKNKTRDNEVNHIQHIWPKGAYSLADMFDQECQQDISLKLCNAWVEQLSTWRDGLKDSETHKSFVKGEASRWVWFCLPFNGQREDVPSFRCLLEDVVIYGCAVAQVHNKVAHIL